MDQYPGPDKCRNEEDDDCDGLIDEEPVDAQTRYGDDDGDGYGDIYDSETACDGPSDYVMIQRIAMMKTQPFFQVLAETCDYQTTPTPDLCRRTGTLYTTFEHCIL